MHVTTIETLVLTIGGFLTVIGLLAKAGATLRRWTRRLNLFFEDFFGEPARPGVPQRPGVVVRLGRLEQNVLGLHTAILDIQAQVNHDHGLSMRDDITAIKKAVHDDAAIPANATVHVNISPGESVNIGPGESTAQRTE